MRYRKNEGVIVQLEVFGEVISSNKEHVTVKIGKLVHTVNHEKVKRVVNEEEEK